MSRSRNRLYVTDLEHTSLVCWLAKSGEEQWLWHARYGHISFHALRALAQNGMVSGLPIIEHSERVCDICLVSKQRRNPFPAEASYRANEALQLLHGDLCGPISPATFAGKKYFLLVMDDHIRYMWTVLIRSKDEALDAINKIRAAVETELNLKVRALWTDRGAGVNSPQSSCAVL